MYFDSFYDFCRSCLLIDKSQAKDFSDGSLRQPWVIMTPCPKPSTLARCSLATANIPKSCRWKNGACPGAWKWSWFHLMSMSKKCPPETSHCESYLNSFIWKWFWPTASQVSRPPVFFEEICTQHFKLQKFPGGFRDRLWLLGLGFHPLPIPSLSEAPAVHAHQIFRTAEPGWRRRREPLGSVWMNFGFTMFHQSRYSICLVFVAYLRRTKTNPSKFENLCCKLGK